MAGLFRHSSASAFTIPNLLVAIGLMLVICTAIMSLHLFGLRLMAMTENRLGASESARAALNRVVGELHATRAFKIGNGDQATFTEIAAGNLQQGTSLQVYTSTNAAQYVRYYLDKGNLMRLTNGNVTSVIKGLSNNLAFACEDAIGNVLSNHLGNSIVRMTLCFTNLALTGIPVGQKHYYTSYQLQTRVEVRAGN